MPVRARGEAYIARRFWLLVAVIAGTFLLGHMPFLRSPFVNFESWFVRAAGELMRGHAVSALRMFEVTNANPLLSVAGIAPFLWLLGPTEAAARLFSLGCAAGTVVVVAALARRELGPAQGVVTAILVALNPVLWTWGGLAYSDGPFVFLIAGALALTCTGLRTGDERLHVGAALLLGLATLTKYNAVAAYAGTILALILTAWHSRSRPGVWLYRLGRVVAIYAVLGTLIAGPYLLWVWANLGHLLAPRYSITLPGADPAGLGLLTLFVLRLAAYLIWLGIFVGPIAFLYLPLIDSTQRWGQVLLLCLGLLMLNIWLAGHVAAAGGWLGEMELGWIVHIAPPGFLIGLMALLLTVGEITVVRLLYWSVRRQGISAALGAWFVGMILVHASVRAANRYTLFLVPVLALFLADLIVQAWLSRRKLAAVAVGLSIVTFLFLGVFNSAYFAEEGRAASALAAHVNANRLGGIPFNPITPWNEVLVHNSYLIDRSLFVPPGSGGAQCDLLTFGPRGPIPNMIHAEEVRLMGVVFKRYAVVCPPPKSVKRL